MLASSYTLICLMLTYLLLVGTMRPLIRIALCSLLRAVAAFPTHDILQPRSATPNSHDTRDKNSDWLPESGVRESRSICPQLADSSQVYICFGQGNFTEPCQKLAVPNEGLWVPWIRSETPITSFGPDKEVVCLIKRTQGS